MKRIFIFALAVVMILTASVTALSAYAATDADEQTTADEPTTADGGNTQSSHHGCRGNKDKVAEPENAIGKDQAKAIALKDAGVAEDAVDKIKACVAKRDDGTVVYKVGVTVGDKYYSYRVNALTGEIVEKSEMSVEEHEASKPAHKHRKHGKPVAEPENAIGKDQAKAIALKDTGLADDAVDKIKAFVIKIDDDTVVYKVGITSGDKYYSYRVNALTGEIVEKSGMSVEEHEAAKSHGKCHETKTAAATTADQATESTTQAP